MGSEPDNSSNSDPADAPREEGLARVVNGRIGDKDGDQDGVVSGEDGQTTGDERAESVASEPASSQTDANEGTPKDATTEDATESAAGGEVPVTVDSAADSSGNDDDDEDEDEDEDEDAEPIESLIEIEPEDENLEFHWYILKVQVNREESIREALLRRVKIHGLEPMFEELVVPTEDVAEYNKAGKRRIVKKKLYPGYIMVRMAINDDSWFLVRETPGIGDFTGSAGKPTPMDPADAERIISRGKKEGEDEGQVKTSIPFKSGDQVRVKDGNFQGFEGDVESIDEAHGRVTVMINIFGRPTPVELEHWQIESV